MAFTGIPTGVSAADTQNLPIVLAKNTASIDRTTQSIMSSAIASQESSASIDSTLMAKQRVRKIVSPTLEVQPNPFSSKATLRFQLPEDDQVFLGMYDNAGRLLKTIVAAQRMEAGIHEQVITDEPLLEGFFYVILRTSKEQLVQKVVVIQK